MLWQEAYGDNLREVQQSSGAGSVSRGLAARSSAPPAMPACSSPLAACCSPAAATTLFMPSIRKPDRISGSIPTGDLKTNGTPMTYRVRGRQYVAIAVGGPGAGATLLAFARQARAARAPSPACPVANSPGQLDVERLCSQCHALETVTRTRRSRQQWQAEVESRLRRARKSRTMILTRWSSISPPATDPPPPLIPETAMLSRSANGTIISGPNTGQCPVPPGAAIMTQPNEKKLNEFIGKMLGDLGGAFSVPTTRIGFRLGLFDTLHKKGPATAADLAARAGGLAPRYVREWALAQAANGCRFQSCRSNLQFESRTGDDFCGEGQSRLPGRRFLTWSPR